MLVFGAGAIGGVLGARLMDAGHDVTLLGRPWLAAAARTGLEIEGHTEGRFQVPVVTSPPARTFDAVFVTTKAHATSAVAPVAARLAGNGVVASLQNGLGNDRKILDHTPRVALCLTSHGVMRTPEGLVHTGTGATVVGVPGGADPEAADIAQGLLQDAGWSPERVQDIRQAVWRKGAVNAAINPLGALHGVTNGEVLAQYWNDAEALASEVWSLGRAAGVALPGVVDAVRETLQNTASNRCSMLQDVEAQRPTEIDQITGYFVRAARRLGYPLEHNEQVYRLVVDMERSYLGEAAVLARARAEAETWSIA